MARYIYIYIYIWKNTCYALIGSYPNTVTVNSEGQKKVTQILPSNQATFLNAIIHDSVLGDAVKRKTMHTGIERFLLGLFLLLRAE